MRIKQISVSGLFGAFDHVIPLNLNERITIVHSPNGFGKTVMLRLLDGFFNSKYSVFQTIPFNNFCIEFDNGSNVEIVKPSNTSEKTRENNSVVFNFYELNAGKKTFTLEEIKSPPLGEVIINNIDDTITLEVKLREETKWFERLKNNIHVRLIESQRLLSHAPSNSAEWDFEESSMSPTVATFSAELARHIRTKLAEYGAKSQSLDRTFPARVLKQQFSSDLTDEQLRHQLSELEVTRSRLIDVGLLDKDDNSEFQIQPQSIDERTKNILSVYVEDVEKKLNVFNGIANRIELFREIINSKFIYSHKVMNFNKEKGFVFTLFHPSSSNVETILPKDLSSGEQHELVLLYELLFKVHPNTLVLIDEPELSLHVGWQVHFLKDLQEITKLADIDVLMATHSPDIIQDRWDLTVELKGAAK